MKPTQESNTELQQTAWRLARRSSRLAIRCLAEEVRKRILGVGSGAEDLTQEQKQHWNRKVDDYSDDELLGLGLSREDLCLTKYGDGGLQQQSGGRAAEDFTKEEIADEVMAARKPASLAKVFHFAYGEAAETIAG